MLATRILRAAGGPPGFWARSMEEFKRQATIAYKMETISGPTGPRMLMTFEEPGSVDRCKVMSDKTSFGGFSEASLTHVAAANGEPAHALFKGNISTEVPPHNPNIQRSGFAAWRTKDRGRSLWGKLLWDIDPYHYLEIKFRSDGRKYFVNIQTESIVPTDLHQHLLPTFKQGQWETVTIPFEAFVRTNHGFVTEPQREMLRQKVRTIGIGLIDRVPGPFELCIANMSATNTEFNAAKRDSQAEKEARLKKEKEAQEPEKILI